MAHITDTRSSPFVKEITFSEICCFWITYLWPGRLSEIEPVSCINSNGDIDINLKKFQPVFFGLYDQSPDIVGVVSACQTDTDEYRMRGICTNPNFRKYGYSNLLVAAALGLISRPDRNPLVWTLAREKNIEYYKKFDFKEHKCVSNFEFGPHIILRNDNPLETYKRLTTFNKI